jgi:phosphohistidine phosphatase
MKTLYVVRHAKSSWDDPDLSDFERPLNARGKRDAPRMGKRLKEKDLTPDCVISSPARRAHSTAKRICAVLAFDKNKIKTERKLYHASEETILSIVQGIKSSFDTVLIFGHNPGLTDFVNEILNEESGIFIDNIPTCGVVALTFNVDNWSNVDWKKGKMIFYDYPKSRDD